MFEINSFLAWKLYHTIIIENVPKQTRTHTHKRTHKHMATYWTFEHNIIFKGYLVWERGTENNKPRSLNKIRLCNMIFFSKLQITVHLDPEKWKNRRSKCAMNSAQLILLTHWQRLCICPATYPYRWPRNQPAMMTPWYDWIRYLMIKWLWYKCRQAVLRQSTARRAFGHSNVPCAHWIIGLRLFWMSICGKSTQSSYELVHISMEYFFFFQNSEWICYA